MIAQKQIYGLGIFLAILVNLISWQSPFFWDTILTSTITQHFYDSGFGNLITPATFDAGHPPLFYLYVTGFYHVFGKSLFAAHLSMLPFIILGVISFIQIMDYFSFNKFQKISGILFLFSILAVLTQYTLVSYDAVLLSLYLSAIATYFKKKKLLFAIVLIGIAGISLRGLFCIASLAITICYFEKSSFKNKMQWFIPIITVLLLTTTWYVYHFIQTGWFFATTAKGWSQQRGIVDGKGLFNNSISIFRSFIDLGIIILTILSLFYWISTRKLDKLMLLWLIPAIVFSISFLPFTNPINHRYFLIVFVLMLFSVIQFLSGKKIIFTLFTYVLLWIGHLQIYPVPVSNGWDCSLVYTSYNSCRTDFYTFLENRVDIKPSEIGTVFPMNASLYQTSLEKDTIRMQNVNGQSIDSIPYVLYSTIGNDFSDEQLEQVRKWQVVYKVNHSLIELILFKNPEFILNKL